MSGTQGVWRTPDEETNEYPNLWVHDGRKSGSITIGRSRLPVWAVIGEAVLHSFEAADDDYEMWRYDFTDRDMAAFLYHLLEARGEFARLLLVIADAERCDRAGTSRRAWWETKRHRKRVGDQLRRCLAVLNAPNEDDEP